MASETIFSLDERRIQHFASQIIAKTELQIDSRILSTLETEATDKQTPSALLVKTLIEALQAKDVELEGKVEQVKTDVENTIAPSITELTEKLSGLESDNANVDDRITNTTNKIDSVSNKISTLNDRITKVDNDRIDVSSNIETISSDTTSLEQAIKALPHLKIDTIVGAIESVESPDGETLYFQKDNEDDKTWVMYIYHVHANPDENHWICVGDTSVDLANYWRKDDVDAIQTAIQMSEVTPMSQPDIAALVEAGWESHKHVHNFIDGVCSCGKSYFDFIEAEGKIVGLSQFANGISEITIPESINGIDVQSIDLGNSDTYNDALTILTIPNSISRISGNNIPGSYPRLRTIVYEGTRADLLSRMNDGIIDYDMEESLFANTFGNISIYYDTPAGFYDANNMLLCKWDRVEAAGINIEENFNSSTTVMKDFISTNCPGAVTVVLPDGITRIGSHAFVQCGNIKNVVLPEGIQEVGDGVFYEVDLSNIFIPKSCIKIGSYAFYSVDHVYYEGTAYEWNNNPDISSYGQGSCFTVGYNTLIANVIFDDQITDEVINVDNHILITGRIDGITNIDGVDYIQNAMLQYNVKLDKTILSKSTGFFDTVTLMKNTSPIDMIVSDNRGHESYVAYDNDTGIISLLPRLSDWDGNNVITSFNTDEIAIPLVFSTNNANNIVKNCTIGYNVERLKSWVDTEHTVEIRDDVIERTIYDVDDSVTADIIIEELNGYAIGSIKSITNIDDANLVIERVDIESKDSRSEVLLKITYSGPKADVSVEFSVLFNITGPNGEHLVGGKYFTVKIANGANTKLAAGLYDDNNRMIEAWENTGIDIEEGMNYMSQSDKEACVIISTKYPKTVKVILPDGITRIGSTHFLRSNLTTNIRTIIIPEGVTSMSGYQFSFDNLQNIVLPESLNLNVDSLRVYSLFSIKNAEAVTCRFGGTKSQWNDLLNSGGSTNAAVINPSITKFNMIYNYKFKE